MLVQRCSNADADADACIGQGPPDVGRVSFLVRCQCRPLRAMSFAVRRTDELESSSEIILHTPVLRCMIPIGGLYELKWLSHSANSGPSSAHLTSHDRETEHDWERRTNYSSVLDTARAA